MERETQLGLTYPSSLIVSGSFNAGIVHLYSFTDYPDTASSMSVIVMWWGAFQNKYSNYPTSNTTHAH